MEFWTICNKSILLIYVILASYFTEITVSPWYMLSVLLFVCVNISIYIVKKDRMKPLFMLLSILLIIISAYYVHPLFLLLIPMNVYELVSFYIINKSGLALFLMLIPLVFLPKDMLLLYGLIALLSFVFFTMLKIHTGRIETYRDDMEKMRSRNDKLTRSLDENNEYIRQSEYTYKLEESNRLSLEIHDKIGHSMTGALIQMEASKLLLAVDPEKAVELLQNAIHISKDGIESIRLVLKNMKPPTEQLGINRMKLFIDEFTAKHSIKTTLTHGGNVDLITPIQWKIILENTKEAFTNLMKYSNATIVSVHIQVLSILIKIEVSDNGIGARKVIKGLGIIGMEERAASVNGKVIVDGSRGFSVTTLLPYEEK